MCDCLCQPPHFSAERRLHQSREMFAHCGTSSAWNTLKSFFSNFYKCIWLHWVSVVALDIFTASSLVGVQVLWLWHTASLVVM